ncbi:MAG: DNA-binding response regulator [Rhodobacteraceae bacterium]|nr:DNA-binding response regulator [Paracoccaceae bacterium]
MLEALRDRLIIAGFQVKTCRSYIEAVDHIRPGYDGVILTDIRMPGKTGLDLVAKAQSIDPELPVIILTGYAETETVVEAMRNGAVTVFEKPCPIDLLLAEILRVADIRSDILKTRNRKAQDAARLPVGRPPKEHRLTPQLAEFEQQLILRALKRNRGDKDKTAKELGISRSKLYAKMQNTGK